MLWDFYKRFWNLTTTTIITTVVRKKKKSIVSEGVNISEYKLIRYGQKIEISDCEIMYKTDVQGIGMFLRQK